jgi:hypothetical protein
MRFPACKKDRRGIDFDRRAGRGINDVEKAMASRDADVLGFAREFHAQLFRCLLSDLFDCEARDPADREYQLVIKAISLTLSHIELNQNENASA